MPAPDELPHDAGATYPPGAVLLHLLLEPSWLRRRVERVEFVGDGEVHRHVSLDIDLRYFELPDYLKSLMSGSLTDMVVPVAMLRNGRALSRFDLRDERGCVLPMPNRGVSVLLGTEILMCMVRILAPQADMRGISAEIKRVLEAAPKDAQAMLRNWRKTSNDGRELYGKHRSLDELKLTLLSNLVFERVIFDLSQNFLLLVPIDMAILQTRQVVKYSYTTALRWKPGFSLRERLAWQATEADIRLPSAGLTNSFHVEVRAPETIDITLGSLRRIPDVPKSRESPLTEIQGRSSSTHLSTHDAKVWDGCYLLLNLRPQRRGLVRTCLLSTLLNTLILWALWITLEIRAKHDGVDVPTAAAILLGIPVVIAAVLLRPDEHPLVSRMCLGIRAVTAGVIIVGMLAIGLMVLSVTGYALLVWLCALAIVSTLLAAMLLVTYLANSHDVRRNLSVNGKDLGPITE